MEFTKFLKSSFQKFNFFRSHKDKSLLKVHFRKKNLKSKILWPQHFLANLTFHNDRENDYGVTLYIILSIHHIILAVWITMC